MGHGSFFGFASRAVQSSSSRVQLNTCRKAPQDNAALTAGAAGLAAAVALTSTGLPGFASAPLLKLSMMVPPPPPPQQAETAAVVDRTDSGFLDLLFPGFDTSSFVWRISMLQLMEYMGSLLIGSNMGAPKLCSLYLLGASWGPAISAGAVWRLIFPMMLHANALHIFFNLFFQLRIGFGMEKQFGRRKFTIIYLFCGFLGNLISVAADPMKLAVGASTSGFGLLGVWAAEVVLTWELLGASRPRIFLWFAFMLLSCVMMSTISPNVDFVGHGAGALAGFLMAIMLADMREEHQPQFYDKAKLVARHTSALLIVGCLFKIIPMGPDGPLPYCGSIFHPRHLPF